LGDVESLIEISLCGTQRQMALAHPHALFESQCPLNADCVETCPQPLGHPESQAVVALGMYELDTETRERRGAIHLQAVDLATGTVHCVGQYPFPGVLDCKWCVDGPLGWK
jgi:hypothetical protein